MKRLAAALVAVGMVALAVVIRSAIDDDDAAGGTTDGELVVLCATDLASQCEALGGGVAVLTADAASTAGELADGTLDPEIDAWITSSAWLEVVEGRAPDALGDRRAIATSPTVMATAPGRFEAIDGLCEGSDAWSCLGDAAGADWGDLGHGSPSWRELKVGITDPDGAAGLPVLASAAVGFFGTTEFPANDPRYPEFESWLANVAGTSGARDADPARTLAIRPGTYSAAGSVAALARQREARGVETIDPKVPVHATIAIVELARGDGLPPTDALRDELEAQGWTRADEDDLAPTLKPGVMAALHSLWRAVTS